MKTYTDTALPQHYRRLESGHNNGTWNVQEVPYDDDDDDDDDDLPPPPIGHSDIRETTAYASQRQPAIQPSPPPPPPQSDPPTPPPTPPHSPSIHHPHPHPPHPAPESTTVMVDNLPLVQTHAMTASPQKQAEVPLSSNHQSPALDFNYAISNPAKVVPSNTKPSRSSDTKPVHQTSNRNLDTNNSSTVSRNKQPSSSTQNNHQQRHKSSTRYDSPGRYTRRYREPVTSDTVQTGAEIRADRTRRYVESLETKERCTPPLHDTPPPPPPPPPYGHQHATIVGGYLVYDTNQPKSRELIANNIKSLIDTNKPSNRKLDLQEKSPYASENPVTADDFFNNNCDVVEDVIDSTSTNPITPNNLIVRGQLLGDKSTPSKKVCPTRGGVLRAVKAFSDMERLSVISPKSGLNRGSTLHYLQSPIKAAQSPWMPDLDLHPTYNHANHRNSPAAYQAKTNLPDRSESFRQYSRAGVSKACRSHSSISKHTPSSTTHTPSMLSQPPQSPTPSSMTNVSPLASRRAQWDERGWNARAPRHTANEASIFQGNYVTGISAPSVLSEDDVSMFTVDTVDGFADNVSWMVADDLNRSGFEEVLDKDVVSDKMDLRDNDEGLKSKEITTTETVEDESTNKSDVTVVEDSNKSAPYEKECGHHANTEVTSRRKDNATSRGAILSLPLLRMPDKNSQPRKCVDSPTPSLTPSLTLSMTPRPQYRASPRLAEHVWQPSSNQINTNQALSKDEMKNEQEPDTPNNTSMKPSEFKPIEKAPGENNTVKENVNFQSQSSKTIDNIDPEISNNVDIRESAIDIKATSKEAIYCLTDPDTIDNTPIERESLTPEKKHNDDRIVDDVDAENKIGKISIPNKFSNIPSNTGSNQTADLETRSIGVERNSESETLQHPTVSNSDRSVVGVVDPTVSREPSVLESSMTTTGASYQVSDNEAISPDLPTPYSLIRRSFMSASKSRDVDEESTKSKGFLFSYYVY